MIRTTGLRRYIATVPTETTKRRLRAPQRRSLIVSAALEEFAIHGYEGASMGQIGAAAGVSRSVLYDHFPSKRALFAALLKDTHRALLAHLRQRIAADAPMEERMRAAMDAFFAFAAFCSPTTPLSTGMWRPTIAGSARSPTACSRP
jgi:AcrR family transcriptional regulator